MRYINSRFTYLLTYLLVRGHKQVRVIFFKFYQNA